MDISKLTLGTAQLGMDYGVANKTGKPSERTAFEILSTAFDNGINCIDTAPVYGNSEEIIGKYLKYHLAKCTVVTKLPLSWLHENTDLQTMKAYVTRSFFHLKEHPIDIYLMRDVMELGKWYDKLLQLKRERFFNHLGVSIYDPSELEYALSFDCVDAFQIPINLFDHRFIPYLPKLKGKIVFTRSIFLQGYLLLENKYTKKLKKICNDFGTNIRETAVTFVRDLPNVTSLVIGAETTEQARDNIDLIKEPKTPDNLRNYIYKEFADMPLEITDPRKWK